MEPPARTHLKKTKTVKSKGPKKYHEITPDATTLAVVVVVVVVIDVKVAVGLFHVHVNVVVVVFSCVIASL